jgi:putative ABC transport system permease protein
MASFFQSLSENPSFFPLFRWVHLFKNLCLHDLRHNVLRTSLTILGVALGVATALSIWLLSQSSVSEFKSGIQQLAGSAAYEIESKTTDRLPETLVKELSWVWDKGVMLRPVIERLAVTSGPNPQVVRFLAVDMLGDQDYREKLWVEGAEPELGKLDIFRKDAVYIGETLAKRLGITRLGQQFSLLVNDQPKQVTVVGILANKGVGGAFSGQVALMDIGSAQQLHGFEGWLSRLEVNLPEDPQAEVSMDTSGDDILGWLKAPVLTASETATAFPWWKDLNKHLEQKGFSLQRPERRGERVEQILQSYHYNLMALSLIALLVGGFLIFNTQSIAVLRRRSLIGGLRALGTNRWEIASLILTESTLIGLLGAGIGWVLGVGFSLLGIQSVSKTVQTLYTGQGFSSLSGVEQTLPWVLLAGVGIALLGAFYPTLEAMRVSPKLALRPFAMDQAITRGWIVKSLVLGLVLLALAFLAAWQPPIQGVPVYGYIAATLGVFGVACLAPAFSEQGLTLWADVCKSGSWVTGRLAALQLLRSPSRSAIAVASLGITLGMLMSMSILIHSFRSTVTLWVNQTLKADLFVQSVAAKVSRESAYLSTETVNKLIALPDVEAADRFLERSVTWEGKRIRLGVGDFDTFLKHGSVIFLNAEPFEQVIQRVQKAVHPSGVISESLANRYHLKVGSTLRLDTPNGPLPIRVEGVYYDFASDQGYLVIPRDTFAGFFPKEANLISNVAIYLRSGASPESFRVNALKALPNGNLLDVRTNQELRQEVLKIFDQTFAITYVMQLIALVVSILAVGNTLVALSLENRSGYGMLRYIGASVQQTRRMVFTQAILLVLMGTLLGILLGYGLSVLLVYVINLQSFGWSVLFLIPWPTLLGYFSLLLGVVLLIGYIPARLVSQLHPPASLRALAS